MKLALVVIVLAACNIHHTSDEYACTKNIDCDPGRVCSDGFCIANGTQIDAAKPSDGGRPDGPGNNCPAGCTTCYTTAKTCTINCMAGANCTNTVSCPAGYRCNILCNTDNSCRNGINCQSAEACDIECTGKQSCQNVNCGTGRCDVNCMAVASCKGVDCSDSCACDVTCFGNQSCGDTVTCPRLACDTGLGCTSIPTLCHSCM